MHTWRPPTAPVDRIVNIMEMGALRQKPEINGAWKCQHVGLGVIAVAGGSWLSANPCLNLSFDVNPKMAS